ncbi:PSP1 domain-containing protein [Olivibacter sitiensis]|uniref:PSP1 domain-containing protein n=1 Tax=Olivibacter sitiensis TaxID=376470 RepID=UPI000482C26B|nr:regulatory iron-sulfur-containing complex subunit RicT [Olivibacter sitiensis]
MGCSSCSSGGGCAPAGCQSNGSCMTNGCNKLDVYDWLSDMDMPANYIAFNIVEIRFKGSRKDFYINKDNLYLEMGEPVAVETGAGGYDIGHVSLTGELVRLQMKKNKVQVEAVEKKIFRKATANDLEKYEAAKNLEWETMHRARKLALDLGLLMKISDVDFQGDRTKATFYYTADGRVDFRELIKRMAEAFRIRIEMRQIGMRQEASRLGGIGSCGRELCCSTWLTDFKTVSTSAARYQNLSLNTLKLAGQCGKLKCCLNYELDAYMDALKDVPSDIDRLETKRGIAYLQKTDIFKKMMWFSYKGDENWIALDAKQVKEIAAKNKEGEILDDIVDVQANTPLTEPTASFDYENVVGQDSLTRLDDKSRKRKKSKNRGRSKNKNAQGGVSEKTASNMTEKAGEGKSEKQQRNKQQAKPSRPNNTKENKGETPGTTPVVNADGVPIKQGAARKKNNKRRYKNRNGKDNQPKNGGEQG